MKVSVPHGDDERLVRHGQVRWQDALHRRPAGRAVSQADGLMRYGRREFDRPGRSPELSALFGLLTAIPVEVVVPMGGSERGPDLGVGQLLDTAASQPSHSETASSVPGSSTSSFTGLPASK